MDLDELQSVRDRERQTDKLQQLRESFYADAGEFIQQLRRERERAADRADDPFDSTEVSRLTDEIDTAEQTVEAIFERRIGKIVKAASLAAADQPMDADGMTAEEQAMFESLVDDIVTTRERVLDVLAGESEASGADESRSDPVDSEAAVSAADLMGSDSEGDSGVEPDREHDPDRPATDPGGEDVRGRANTGPETGSTTGETEQSPAEEQTAGQGSDSDHRAGTDRDHHPGTDRESRETDGHPEPANAERPGDEQTAVERAGDEQTAVEQAGARQAVAGAATEGTDGNDSEDADAASERPVRNDGGMNVDRETVRVTDDVGSILGVDEREYDLAAEDVVTLPAVNAGALVERDAAERLE